MHRATLSALLTIGLLLPSASAEEPVPWDVETLPGTGSTLELDLTEATWAGVDVHPDGDRLLFDVLGDLYVLPIGGGEATALSEGAAWDTEGRWSPDGAEIVFTSDRGGNRNLWIAKADGSEARAWTTETETRVSDAAWTPDGQHVVARKRHTDTSSIGLHELWLFDRYGGKGLALTKKEKTAGLSEPAVSPDGRWVYFSARDARYRYDRDPNRGIWQIRRLDRRTGKIRPLTGEFGGAIRPTPSPDGEQLALVRRVRTTTVLELYDLNTGARRQIADWLSRDEQEGFAASGLYPRMDWTPDGRHLVLWAQGKLWSVEVATGERTEIPFHLTAKRAVAQAVRPTRSPVSETVAAKLVRWPVLGPDGAVIYSALGSLWRQDAGGAVRLTDAQHREYAPAFSRDGRWLAWVSWNDERGGALHVRKASGGKVRTVGPVGPKYSNPSFSPDGRSLVFLRGSGGHLRGRDLAGELWSEIATLDLDSGALSIVTETAGLTRAVRPVFSPDGRRILFPEEREAPLKSADGVLYSVNLDGTDRRIVLEVGHATDVMPSPDGRWVAFTEAHHAWIARVPEAGAGPLTVAKEEGAVAVWRLSEEAGDWVAFSPDGAAVSWSNGPELRRLNLDALLDWQVEQQAAAGKEEEGVDEDEDDVPKPPVPPSEAIPLTASLPRAAPTGAIALTNARIVTMKGDEVLDGATILTKDDRIVAVGTDVSIPEGTKVVDVGGKTVLPGLIDVHAHLHFSALDTMPEQDWRYVANLAYGVTTVHDPSVFTDQAFVFAELVEAGRMVGPRVFSTGEILYGASGSFRSQVSTKEDALRHVRRMKAMGAISVKSYQQPRRDQRQWIVEAGLAEDILIVPEGGGDTLNNLGMIVDGHSAIEHALPTAPLHADIVGLFAGSDTYYTPTLLVAYGGLSGEHYFYAKSPVWKDERLLRFTPQGIVDARARRLRAVAPEDDWHHQAVARGAAAIQRAGGKVSLGGHGQLQGLGSHWELWALAGPGAMTPLEAIRSGTLHGANYLGMGEHLGSLEPGKLADFFVVDGDPLADIEATANVVWTVKNGVLYDAGTMDRVWPDPAPAPTLIHEIARGDLEGGCAAERLDP